MVLSGFYQMYFSILFYIPWYVVITRFYFNNISDLSKQNVQSPKKSGWLRTFGSGAVVQSEACLLGQDAISQLQPWHALHANSPEFDPNAGTFFREDFP